MIGCPPWFLDWVARHQAWNHHNGWPAFQQPGFALVFSPWAEAFAQRGVSEAEADHASTAMARGKSLYPEHHLGRLLEILAPVVGARLAQAERDDRQRAAERADVEQAEYREAKGRWMKLPEPERAGMPASARERSPHMAPLAGWIERLAIDEWRGRPHAGGSSPAASPEVIAEAAQTPPAEVELTPGQLATLAHLPAWLRPKFDRMSPGRRREVLAPHAEGFNRTMLAVTIADIGGGSRQPELEPEREEREVQAGELTPAIEPNTDAVEAPSVEAVGAVAPGPAVGRAQGDEPVGATGQPAGPSISSLSNDRQTLGDPRAESGDRASPIPIHRPSSARPGRAGSRRASPCRSTRARQVRPPPRRGVEASIIMRSDRAPPYRPGFDQARWSHSARCDGMAHPPRSWRRRDDPNTIQGAIG